MRGKEIQQKVSMNIFWKTGNRGLKYMVAFVQFKRYILLIWPLKTIAQFGFTIGKMHWKVCSFRRFLPALLVHVIFQGCKCAWIIVAVLFRFYIWYCKCNSNIIFVISLLVIELSDIKQLNSQYVFDYENYLKQIWITKRLSDIFLKKDICQNVKKN